MSRPKPTVLLEHIDKKTYKSEQVLQSEGLWAVYYKNEPFNLKEFNILVTYPGPTYKRQVFSNPGHAINLCKKLNKKFKTQDFSVVLLRDGETVFSE